MSDKKKYTLAEFITQAKSDLDDYQKDWDGSTEPSNEFHESQHTWAEWWGAFGRYFSWEER